MLLKFANYISSFLTSIMSLINIREWYLIRIKKDIHEYPFGYEGSVPYYYKTAELYALVNLTWGITFFLLLLLLIYGNLMKKKPIIKSAVIIIGVLFAIHIIHGYIGK